MSTAITEDEAALYDRQIRLWGLEAQHRMRNASILIAGVRGLSNEVTKNIVLAGVGSITLLEHEAVSIADLGAQFLLREEDVGRNRADAAAEKARLLNPRVKIVVDMEDIAQKSEDFFKSFNIVCLTGCTPDQLIRIDGICRRNGVGFYAAATHGFFGYIFCDLTRHEYREETQEASTIKGGEPETVIVNRTQEYLSLQDTLEITWNNPRPKVLRRKISPLYFAIQVLWAFQQKNDGRLPKFQEQKDMDAIISLKEETLIAAQVDPKFVQDELLETLISTSAAEISPVCAIVGGFLAQDILKTLSQKDSPIHNYFMYNGLEGSGLVHKVEKQLV